MLHVTKGIPELIKELETRERLNVLCRLSPYVLPPVESVLCRLSPYVLPRVENKIDIILFDIGVENEIDKILSGIGVNSFNRFETFIKLIPKLNGKSYWYALRHSYVGTDNLFRYSGIIKFCFLKNEPQREYLMLHDEREYLKTLPEQITIYRGMTEDELKQKSFGLSWTLKKEVADFFANDYQRNFATKHLKKVVHEMTINKSEVIAFFNCREEFEIIYIKNY